MVRTFLGVVVLLGMVAVSSGCQTHAQNGAVIGGTTGAILGGLIGSYSHANAGGGAAIGAGVGTLAGYMIGNELDKTYGPPRYGNSQPRVTYYPPAPRPRAMECPPPPPRGYYYESRTYGPGYYRESRTYSGY